MQRALCLQVLKSDAEWRQALSPVQYNILRQKGTEPPRSGEYDKFYPKEGYFACAGCGNPLYSAQSKFDSGCGWPAFDKCYEGGVKTEVCHLPPPAGPLEGGKRVCRGVGSEPLHHWEGRRGEGRWLHGLL